MDSHPDSHYHHLPQGHHFAPYFARSGHRKTLARNHQLDHRRSWAAARRADSQRVRFGSRHPFATGREPAVRSLRQPAGRTPVDRNHWVLVGCMAQENLAQRAAGRSRQTAHMDHLGRRRAIVAAGCCSLVEEERVRIRDQDTDCYRTTGAGLVADNRPGKAGSAADLRSSVVLRIRVKIDWCERNKDLNSDQN